MTEPTDGELDMLIDDVAGLDSSNEAFRKFARAVLAKWGTPPAVAGEPECTCSAKDAPFGTCCKVRSAFERWYDEQNYGRLQPFDVFKGGWIERHRLSSTPQPTPTAQAAESVLGDAETALRKVLGVVQRYLPPPSPPDDVAAPAVAGEPVAWRYRPSAVWDDYVLTDDPGKAARARGNGLHVEALCLTTPQPTQTQAGAVPLYRLLQSGVDRIEAADEFLSDDTTAWAIDPNGIFVGSIYGGHVLRPARRRIKGGQHGADN